MFKGNWKILEKSTIKILFFVILILPFEVSSFTQKAKLMSSDGELGKEGFGRSVAIHGNIAVVGSPSDDVENKNSQGAAYVFEQKNGVWNLQQKLVASDGEAGDWFGSSTAFDGKTLAIGVPGDDLGGNKGQGSVYIYTLDSNVWTLRAKLNVVYGKSEDHFGTSVAIKGDYLVAGSSANLAYIFKDFNKKNNWIQYAKLSPPDGEDVGQYSFGKAVAIDGDTVVVGASQQNGGTGAAYLYNRQVNEVWTLTTKLDASEGKAHDYFGTSIAIEGNTIAIGAFNDDLDESDIVNGYGSVYIFTLDDNGWSQQAKLVASDGEVHDHFGSSIAIKGNTVVIGAPDDDVKGKEAQGAAYTFTRNGGNWKQQSKLVASDGTADDRFGDAVALDTYNNLIAGTGMVNKLEPGAAYIFKAPSLFDMLKLNTKIKHEELQLLKPNINYLPHR